MADPLLTSLCSVCHVASPKYRCPRCQARTCSASCIKKHKARSSCTGVRDPTVFVPTSKLRTPAGIDHDYNFLSSIERARERTEKIIVEGKALLQEKELRPDNEDRHYEKVWYGDELRHKLRDHKRKGHFQEDEKSASQFERHIRRRLRELDIEVFRMPAGMSRQRENKTTWNRLRRVINWQIEWMVFDPVAAGGSQPLRILHKVLDVKPLNQAFVDSLEYHRSWHQKQAKEREQGPDEPPAKKRKLSQRKHAQPRAFSQEWISTCWVTSTCISQDHRNTSWSRTSDAAAFSATMEDECAEMENCQFFLLKPSAASGPSKMLIPLLSSETLESALSGREVLEFPTVFVLPPSSSLPPGFALGSTDRRERRTEARENYAKRETGPFGKGRAFNRNQHQQRPQRGRKVAFVIPKSEDREDGEIKSDNEPHNQAKDESGSGGSSGSEDESPDGGAVKPHKGLVEYDSTSSSDSESDSGSDGHPVEGAHLSVVQVEAEGRPTS